MECKAWKLSHEIMYIEAAYFDAEQIDMDRWKCITDQF